MCAANHICCRSSFVKSLPWSISKWHLRHSAATKLSSALIPRPLPPPQLLCAACTILPDPQAWQSSPATSFSNFLLRMYWCFAYNYGLQCGKSVFISAFKSAAAAVASAYSGFFNYCPSPTFGTFHWCALSCIRLVASRVRQISMSSLAASISHLRVSSCSIATASPSSNFW